MDIVTCEARINNLVLEMSNEGILTDQFTVLVATRRAGDHLHVVKVIHTYCYIIDCGLTALSNYLRQPIMYHAGATVWAGHLRTIACGAGIESLRIACFEFMMASAYGNKEQCLGLLHILYREYFRLRAKFMAILQGVDLIPMALLLHYVAAESFEK